MRAHYWSCSKLASWIIKTFCKVKKPPYATMLEWHQFKKEAMANNRFAFWIADKFLSHLQDFVMWPSDKLQQLSNYVDNRFITKTHVLNTKLKPGQYHELNTRILHGLFEELVDFIEIETAWSHVVWSKQAQEQFKAPVWRTWWKPIRIRVWRCPEAGLAHLNWAAGLVKSQEHGYSQDDPELGLATDQAFAAKEQLRLYNWWKFERPQRVDPHDASGWSAWCDSKRSTGDVSDLYMERDEQEKIKVREMLDHAAQLEQQYDQQDQQMMIDLIKISNSLWT